MKKQLIIQSFMLLCISLFFGSVSLAQTAKKNTVRLKVTYTKIMDGEVYFDMKASSRIDRQNVNVSNIELNVYNVLDDDVTLLGKAMTNMDGICRFTIDNFNAIQPDSTNVYTIKVMFKGNDAFKKAAASVSFKDAAIDAKLITKDSINYIQATLINKSTDSVMADQSLSVQVQRLFQALQIEEFNITDESGTILVPIEEGIPGIDGKLNIEVILRESDEFGTVKAIVVAPIGIPIVDESTFDERTMWSPRNKTPIFLLIFPNLLIFGMWSLIIYLITNLFKITKS